MYQILSILYVTLLFLFFTVSMSFKLAAGEVLHGVYSAPQNKEESRKNVEQVLQFISSRHIRMPHISARGKLREKYISTEPFNQISIV